MPTTIVWVSISFFQFSTFVLYLHKLVLFYFDFCRLFSRVIFLSFCNHCYYWAECWYALCLLLFFVSYIFFSTSTNWGINCDDCSCSIRASSLEVFGQMTQLLKVSTIFLFSSIFFLNRFWLVGCCRSNQIVYLPLFSRRQRLSSNTKENLRTLIPTDSYIIFLR